MVFENSDNICNLYKYNYTGYGCYSSSPPEDVTRIPIAGILFPLPLFLLISIRQQILPKFFSHEYLRELDAAEYEENAGTPLRNLSISFKERESCDYHSEGPEDNFSDAEILDEMTTHRGELKLRTKLKEEKLHQAY
ncbi:hypothetical protein F3Y22_tig00110499pilonHSYRG00008 [Hibiscus syriacus]|uniref:Uncharacterized protein n=1 Tax=Hibiscus syriacus TaxID=106335 RepID=A0A6A3AHC9_HIBSY|nr:hypothetical protein F3Y22_tig00110499pilonHSYRG00008 [Hibiscus syriacus]